jgi:hypothetical protein
MYFSDNFQDREWQNKDTTDRMHAKKASRGMEV